MDYVAVVDWQQLVSLVIVALAAATLLWRKFYPRRFSFERDTHCGCASASGPRPSIRFRARKGQRPVVHLKAL